MLRRKYHITDSAAFRRASASVSAQWTIVNVAARSFTKRPAGFASASPARYSWIRDASSSGGTPIVNERSPRPCRPAISWLAGLVDAIQSGGGGLWGGLGGTRRGRGGEGRPSPAHT